MPKSSPVAWKMKGHGSNAIPTPLTGHGMVFMTCLEAKTGKLVYASPAIYDGMIFLRGEKHLYGVKSRK